MAFKIKSFGEFLRLIGGQEMNPTENMRQWADEDDAEFKARKEKAIKNANVRSIKTIGNSVSSAIDKWGSAWLTLEKTKAMSQINITKANYNKQADILKAQLSNLNVQISKTLSSGLGILTKTANEAAYDSGRAVQEIAKSNLKTRLDIINIGKKADVEIAQAKFDVYKAEKELANQITSTAGSALQTVASALGPVGAGIGAVLNAGASILNLTRKKDIMKGEIAMEYQKLQLEQYNKATEIVNQQVTLMESYVEPFRNLVQQIDTFAGKFDTATHVFAATIGYNGTKGREFADYYRKAAISVAKTFGASAEEIQKLQEGYMSASSRAVNLSIGDMLNTMSVSRLFGMSSSESAQLFGGMNVFNTSISDGSDMMNHMYKTITKIGLSSSKFGKDLVQNLKLAEKYNFKGGLKNMMELTKWAQQTRFNLNSATSFADKLVNGSLSEVLESSAKLQVLGGSAAIYSDPLGMMYDAGADVGDMAKRMASMFSDISGTFNKETGETEFSWYENRMIGARAQALGMDPGEVRNMIRQNQKQGVINEVLSGLGLSEDDMLALGNRATFNRDENRWEVTDIHGNTHDIKEYGNGSNLNIKDLLPENNDDAMLEIAQKSLGIEEEMKNLQEVITTTLTNEQFGDYTQNIRDRMQEQKKIYLQNSSNVNQISSIIRKFDTESMVKVGENLATLVSGKGALKQYFTLALDESGINPEKLGEIQSALTAINTGNIETYLQRIIAKMSDTVSEEEFKEMKGKLEFDNNHQSGHRRNKFLSVGGQRLDFAQAQNYVRTNYGFDIGDQEDWNFYDYFKDKNDNIYRIKVARKDAKERDPAKRYNAGGADNILKKLNKGTGQWEEYKDKNGENYKKTGGVERARRELGIVQIADGVINKRGIATSFVSQNGRTTKIDAGDNVFAATDNGPFALLLNKILPGLQALITGNGGSSNELNIKVSGKLDLVQGGSSINIVDIIKNDPTSLSRIASMLKRTTEINQSGKSRNNYYMV